MVLPKHNGNKLNFHICLQLAKNQNILKKLDSFKFYMFVS